MIRPSRTEYLELARRHRVVPVVREAVADQETPVSAFRKLAPSGTAALLESLEGGEKWGRYSVLGLRPRLTLRAWGRKLDVEGAGAPAIPQEGDPLDVLQSLVESHGAAPLAGLPRLSGGAIGFAGYDIVRRIETLPEGADDDLGLPELAFVLFESVLVFDRLTHTVQVVHNSQPDRNPERAYDAAVAETEDVLQRLEQPAPPEAPAEAGVAPPVRSRIAPDTFHRGVERARKYIRAGDVIQVVLSQRLESDLEVPAFDVYRALRVVNPSPYMYYLRIGDLEICGASPEVLVRREGNMVETRPIAGTRARGLDEVSDRILQEELLASDKERAEHVMLVDLARNDLGRICRYGTVATDEFMSVERYSHVMHIVSNVRGELADGVRPMDVLRATFPAGTVSGAPKIRAMEIIEELEPVRRGVYAGAVGYLDYHGNMDMAIAIRTLVAAGGKAYAGVGAGIVADSDPDFEYHETLRKGSALVRALELAHRGLQRFEPASLGLPRVESPPEGA
ncbi:MAG: anthranilate synthase component I [Candidatus Eisenbacteria bacterium]|nr:anthranilate synthase component I [Candidatus Eisenbacteria bacterium]